LIQYVIVPNHSASPCASTDVLKVKLAGVLKYGWVVLIEVPIEPQVGHRTRENAGKHRLAHRRQLQEEFEDWAFLSAPIRAAPQREPAAHHEMSRSRTDDRAEISEQTESR
jgi:hypothetical protein